MRDISFIDLYRYMVLDTSDITARRMDHLCVPASKRLILRLKRFSRAYEMKEKCPQYSWTKIAYACYCYDQMHFIRDWRFFTDTSPVSLEANMDEVAILRNLRRH